MKIVFLLINFLICFSTLLDSVRKDIINKALSKLPKRENTDILKLGIEMSKSKENYELTEIESAYFAYKWIIQNIEFDKKSFDNGNDLTGLVTTFKEGKGGAIGISALFNSLCGLLNIESNSIFGLTKTITFNYTKIIQIRNYAWNYILIDGEYYLIDPSLRAGFCKDKDLSTNCTDNYFGTNPEEFIRFHFPNDNKWQLLSEPITKDNFTSMAFLFEYFYILGFKTISPDIQTTKAFKSMQVRLTGDDSVEKIFDDLHFMDMARIEGESPMFSLSFYVDKIKSGLYGFDYKFYDTGLYEISTERKSDNTYYPLLCFEAYKNNTFKKN